MVRAYRYLYKPYEKSEIQEVLNDVLKELSSVPGLYLEKKSDEKVFIRFSCVYYIEALGDGTVVYLKDDSIVNRKTLKFWVEVLPGDFYQIHKSYIANMYFIKKITNATVILVNNKEIPLSVRKRRGISEKYYEYLKTSAKRI